MAIDPRTGREYVTPLAQKCHEAYLRRVEETNKRWRSLPIEERAAIWGKRLNRYKGAPVRTDQGDAHEHLYELEPLT